MEQKTDRTMESHTLIRVSRNVDFLVQIGRGIYFDLVDHNKVHSFRIQNEIRFNQFKEMIAKEFSVPIEYQRFWQWGKRKNNTYRPLRPLTLQQETLSVGLLMMLSNKTGSAELDLFLEVELGLDLHPIPPPKLTKEDILLFFKLYDPEKEQLRYVGRIFVNSNGKPLEILGELNRMAGFAPNEELELYEEIRFEPTIMCELVDQESTYRDSQLQNGDIICFQKCLALDRPKLCRYPDVASFLEYVLHHQVAPRTDNMQLGTTPPQSNPDSIKSTETPIPKLDPVPTLLPNPKNENELDRQAIEPVGLMVEASTEVQHSPKPDEGMKPTQKTQSGAVDSLLKYPCAGQLFEEGQHHHDGILNENFEDIGGFSVLKTQASLYKQIWLKYGHIASSKVLATSSYIGKVWVVSDIMTSISEMHICGISEVTSEMIDSWEKKLIMAEKLEFNIRWLKEHFENVKKDFYGEQRLKTALLEEDQSLQASKAQLVRLEDELKRLLANVCVVGSRIDSMLGVGVKYQEKASRLVLDGLF